MELRFALHRTSRILSWGTGTAAALALGFLASGLTVDTASAQQQTIYVGTSGGQSVTVDLSAINGAPPSGAPTVNSETATGLSRSHYSGRPLKWPDPEMLGRPSRAAAPRVARTAPAPTPEPEVVAVEPAPAPVNETAPKEIPAAAPVAPITVAEEPAPAPVPAAPAEPVASAMPAPAAPTAPATTAAPEAAAPVAPATSEPVALTPSSVKAENTATPETAAVPETTTPAPAPATETPAVNATASVTAEPAPTSPADEPATRVAAVTPNAPVPAETAPAPVVTAPSVPDGVSLILFGTEGEAVPDSQKETLVRLAAAYAETEQRIQLKAYAGTADNNNSLARRLSLKRALAVRSFLMDQGIRGKRIDVRALGVANDGGPADRVEISTLAQ